ncbi:MAG: hypothetical protein AAFX81_13215 [Pseudomonadota bacterium]
MILARAAVAAHHVLGGLGRRATGFLAAGIFLGVLIPPAAALARPLLTPAMALLLLATVLRIEPNSLLASLQRRWLVAAAVLWALVVAPLLVVPAVAAAAVDPFLADHLVLTAASAPIIAAASFALLLGLDAAFTLAAAVVASALVPFTLPAIAGVLLGVALPVEPPSLLLRLALLIGGAAAAATLIRRILGAVAIRDAAPLIDGIVVVVLLVFGLAVMDGVTAALIGDPWFVLRCLAGAFALAFGLFAATSLLFVFLGLRMALTFGLLTGFSNFGVVVAALGPAAEPATVVYLGLAQFPIYMLPILLRPVVSRLLAPRHETDPRRW